MILKLEGVLPFTWFAIKANGESGYFVNSPVTSAENFYKLKDLTFDTCKRRNDTVYATTEEHRFKYAVQQEWHASDLTSPVTFQSTVVQSKRHFWKNLTLSLLPCEQVFGTSEIDKVPFLDEQSYIIHFEKTPLGRIKNNTCGRNLQHRVEVLSNLLLPGFRLSRKLKETFRCSNGNNTVSYAVIFRADQAFKLGVELTAGALWPEKLSLKLLRTWRNRRLPVSSDLVLKVSSVNIFYVSSNSVGNVYIL